MDSTKAVHLIPVLIALFWMSQSSWAKTSPQTEIHVSLLGQPCLLQGPFDEATLKIIHSIGPAQIYPNLSPLEFPRSKEQARKALEKIRANTNLPSLLDRYRERLARRLESQIAFLDGLESTKTTRKSASLLKVGKRFLQDRNLKTFETLLVKMDASSTTPNQYRDLTDQLFDTFNDGIERDPEEDFHRAIKKMNVQYTCSFEESEDLAE